MSRWTFTITAPCDWISSNQREHWAAKAERTKQWRDTARVYAIQAKLPKLDHVHVGALLHFRDNRQRDVHNYMPTLKAIVDGLVDYGLVKDDSSKYLTGPDIRIGERRRGTRGSYAPCGFVTVRVSKPPAPEGMAWCGVCEIAVTVLGDGRINGHGRHGQACAGSWARVVPSGEAS